MANPKTLNLIAPMSMGAYVKYPTAEPSPDDQEQFVYEATLTPFDSWSPVVVRLERLWPAQSEVRIELVARAELATNSPDPDVNARRYVSVHINDELVTDTLWKYADGKRCGALSPSRATLTIDKDGWNYIYVPGRVAELRFQPSPYVMPWECPESSLEMRVEFTHTPSDPPPAPSPYLALASFGTTMVAGPDEEQGKLHHHAGEFVLDRKRGCLCVRNASVFYPSDPTVKAVYSDAGVSPAIATATRPGGGCLESRCVGELGGAPVRFSAEAICDLE